MSGGKDVDFGRAYRETQQAMCQICGKIDRILRCLRHFLLPSDSVCFRQVPPSSFSFRLRSLLVRLSGGQMYFGKADVGRSYLETQQAMGRICGRNRPNLATIKPFFGFRLLPPDSVSFRHLPSASVCGRFWSVCLAATYLLARMMMRWKPNMSWAKFAGEIEPNLGLFAPFSCLRQPPSASVRFRHRPSASVCGRAWSVCLVATCLLARKMVSGGNIWKPSRPWAEF